jgi:hypothetical protein
LGEEYPPGLSTTPTKAVGSACLCRCCFIFFKKRKKKKKEKKLRINAPVLKRFWHSLKATEISVWCAPKIAAGLFQCKPLG